MSKRLHRAIQEICGTLQKRKMTRPMGEAVLTSILVMSAYESGADRDAFLDLMEGAWDANESLHRRKRSLRAVK